jgi:hypothetical protein
MTEQLPLIDEETMSEAITGEIEEEGGISEATIDRYLRALRHYQGDIDAANRLAQAEVDRVEAWRTAELAKSQRAVDYLTARLKQHSQGTGAARRSSPNGVLSWTRGRVHIEIIAEDFCDRHADSEFVRHRMEPDKTAITAHIEETGVIPYGCDRVRGEDKFKIQLP